MTDDYSLAFFQEHYARHQIVDIGCNLTHDSFDVDRESVIQRAVDVGVSAFVITGADEAGSVKACELAEQFADRCFATVGLHPHVAKDFNSSVLKSLKELAQREKVRALGEMGLDFNRNFSSASDQEKAFEAQLGLACELEMPVFLHQRDAHDRFFAILKSFRDDLPRVVVHCFTDTERALFDYLDLDCHIGITGWICDERRGEHLHDFVVNVPLNRLMIESDSPYLLPRNVRPKPKSRRNEPVFLPFVLVKLAECRGEAVEVLAQETSKTACEFFGIDSIPTSECL